MASKAVERYRALSCTGKRYYKSLDRAEDEVETRAMQGIELRAYKCKFCQYWHVGHYAQRQNAISRPVPPL